MTNKPMLSVERELLELVTDNRYINKESISIRRWEALCKLRSILSKPAAQHHGEPVAICRLWNEGGSGERTSVEFIGEPCADGTLLYAEQPASVAVPLNSLAPFRTIIEKACEEFNYCCARSDDAGEAIAAHQGLRAMLDAWPSDNPVPAPVAVVMRECEHGGSAGKCLWCKSGNLELVLPNIRDVSGSSREQAMCASTWNACIAEVARLNWVKP